MILYFLCSILSFGIGLACGILIMVSGMVTKDELKPLEPRDHSREAFIKYTKGDKPK